MQRRACSCVLIVSLLLGAPGSELWAYGARLGSRGGGRSSTSLGLPAGAVPPTAGGQVTALAAGVVSRGIGAAAAVHAPVYDGSPPAAEEAEPVVSAPADLGLPPDALERVGDFAATVHDLVSAKFKSADFTIRDFEAWKDYVRLFTPRDGLGDRVVTADNGVSLEVHGSLRAGAEYVYRDALETESDRAAFDEILKGELAKLSLPDPMHGRDDALGRALLKRAEPIDESSSVDEESPFRVPLSELVPDQSRSDLIRTNETLRRLKSAQNAFALRDPMLMVGPPAAIKSALPRYMAAEHKIPYLAVTMHPGIGAFELVGGYRPRELRIHDSKEAARVVREALADADSSGEAGALLDAGVRVYGHGTIEDVRERAGADLAAAEKDPAALRRVVTLAHALRYGESALAWQDGYLTYALKNDLWINFEELNAAPTEVLEFLNEFMRTKRLVITQKLGKAEVVSPRPGGRFMLWATMNPETDSNRNVLARTLKNRWRVKHFGDLPSAEMAEILQKKFGLPPTWAVALVENVHGTLATQAHDRLIGQDWRDGYVFNFRHLLRVARRWRSFVDALPPAERGGPGSVRQLQLLAREALSVYGGPMRREPERLAVFTLLDQALRLSDNGVTRESITPAPMGFQDLGDRVVILDVEIRKGPGGSKVPVPKGDFLTDPAVWARLYEYAKALSLGEPILLMGETGAGKTTELEYLFSVLGYNLHYKNLDSDTAHEEVVGGYVSGGRRGSFVFSEGMLPEAMEEGSAVFLDEFNLNPLVEWMNTVVDDGTLYLPHRIVRGRPFLVAAANPPEPSRYGGRLLLSPALRSRWQEFWVPRDLSRERLKRLMTHWLSGGVRFFGRGAGGMASWTDAARDLWGRMTSKKKDADSPEVEPEPEGSAGKPASLEEILKSQGVPEADWPAVRLKVERLATAMKMVGVSVGRDTSLSFQPGFHWAYFFETNTITYPLVDLLTHSEEEVMGVIDHEGGHRDITVVEMGLPLVQQYFTDPAKHFLWNAIEDPRVNNWVKHRLPGAEHYLHKLYDRYVPEDSGPLPQPPSPKELEEAMKGDAGTAFDPRFLGLPHIEFAWGINYYWRHGKVPEFRSPSAREAFDKARSDLDTIFTRFPRRTDPSREQRLAYTLDALRTIDERIWPLYEPLVKRSEEKLGDLLRNNKNGRGKSSKPPSGQVASGGMPSMSPPPPSKNQPSGPQDGKSKAGDGSGKSEKSGKSGKSGQDSEQGGSGGDTKKSWWDRFKKKSGTGADDGEPDPKRPRDEYDERAKEAIARLSRKAADDLAPKIPAQGTGQTKSGASSGARGGSEPAKPLSLADIVRTQKEILFNEESSPYQKIYRQVADAAARMVTHLENVLQKNARPADIGYYRQGRRPDIKRAMRREGEGGGQDDIWLKRVEATKRRYKISIVVDESSSMQEKRRYALQAVVLLVDALHRLQIDVEVIGFSASAQVHLPFGRPLSAEEKEKLLARLDETVGKGPATHDADAVKLALERILAEEGDGKFILVVTDGEGNGPSSLSSVLPQAEAAGVGVIGVGVGDGMSYVQTSYPRHVLVPDYSKLPLELKTRIESYIQERELGVASASRGQYSGMPFWFAGAPQGRFAYPWWRSAAHSIAAFIGVWFQNLAFFVWIAACLVGLAYGHFLLAWLGGVVLGTVVGFIVSYSSVQETRFFQSIARLWTHKPERVSEESNAAAYALSRAFPDAARLKLEKELQDLIDNHRPGRWPAHPFLAFVSADWDLRGAVWERFGKEIVARAPALAAETIAAVWRGGGDWSAAEVRVLSESGFWGRQTLARAIETGFVRYRHYKAALVALLSNIAISGGVSAEETPRLRALFKKYEYDAPEALQALERVAVPAALEILAPGSFASEAEALLARARSWLTFFVPGDHVDRLRSREVQDGIRALEGARAGGDEDGGVIAAARLGRLLGESRGAGT